MTTSQRAMALALAVGGWLDTGQAQPMISPPAPEVLVSTQFRTPLTYEAALARLGEYYDVEIGRKLPAALPQIGPQQHFELWHDMWVGFETVEGGTRVTLRRPADGSGRLMVKTWMLGLAGHIEAPLPLVFKEDPPLRWVEGDIYASARDLARVFQSDASLKRLPTWEHAGLLVSASPTISMVLAPGGLHGIHHLTVSAETLAAARQFWNRASQGVLKPGIYGAYSEQSELDSEIANLAKGKAETLGATNSQALYIPVMDPKLIEAKLRAEPEMNRRVLAAQGQYVVRFRIDKPYRKVLVNWTELAGYTRADGRHQGERPLGQDSLASPKAPALPAAPLVARTKLENLQPGAYRVTLQGENSAGELSKIDERVYWYDGKNFEEL